MAASKLVFVLVVMVVASFQLQSTVAQTTHVVADAFGWNIPSAADTYTTWASRQTFAVGDSLLFNFTTGFHDVTEVSQAAYGPCTIASPINSVTTGPATVILRTPGNHYYICSVGAHCRSGQKLTINVAAAGTAGTPPPSTSSPAPAGSMMPPPSPPAPAGNASPSFSAVVPATFLAAALAFFY
ncbi:unnamed protein product [Lactuca saligna]|uniref:Phytocyanin domain-containing protein n=1 Tax=Lactuca saligna TaxID=75948 RepID=A0AA35ZJN4_LACSI|nr:unnamed protein product [Lactuca saligna]